MRGNLPGKNHREASREPEVRVRRDLAKQGHEHLASAQYGCPRRCIGTCHGDGSIRAIIYVPKEPWL